MTQQCQTLQFSQPGWVEDHIHAMPPLGDAAARMNWVIDAARRNIDEETGGPFAAAVFEIGSGALVALGVNRVIPEGLSALHAEVVALSLAQRALGTHDLAAEGLPPLELVCSAEPCVMCFGAIHWAGLRGLSVAARSGDVAAIGFDEGDKVADWVSSLERRGIAVTLDVCRKRAREVLQYYGDLCGVIYNARGADLVPGR